MQVTVEEAAAAGHPNGLWGGGEGGSSPAAAGDAAGPGPGAATAAASAAAAAAAPGRAIAVKQLKMAEDLARQVLAPWLTGV